MKFVLKRLHEDAIVPTYQTPGSAGADLCSVEDVEIPEGQTRVVSTGLAIEIPAGFEIQIRPRSGLAAKHSVTVLNTPGTIDSDYRGEVKVILINHGTRPFAITKGDRIAQMVIGRVFQAGFEEALELNQTLRGAGGFGSTGRN
jgi:dUTP pyrophosphatase